MNNTPISINDIFGGWVYRTIGGMPLEKQVEAKLALLDSIVKFQQKLDQPSKSRDGYGYKYADLADVIRAIKSASNGLDIAYIQQPVSKGNQVGVHNYLVNSKGAIADWGSYMIEVNNSKAQSNGSALTYARRYSISCIFGIASENDDDAQKLNSKPTFVTPEELQGLTVNYKGKATQIVDVYAKALQGDELAKQILRAKDAKPATKDAVKSLDQIYLITKEWKPKEEAKDPFADKKVDSKQSDAVDDLFKDME